MLVKFSVENYLSFKTRATLDMQAGTIKEHEEHVIQPLFNKNYKILKSAALYGANSNGKSNFIKAFSFKRDLIINSSKESNTNSKIAVEPFLLSEETENEPSVFETVFFLEDIRYKYGFTVTADFVESEWLIQMMKTKEESIFIRHRKEYVYEKKFKSEFKNQLELLTKVTRDNALFISVLAQFNIAIGIAINEWFSKILVATDEDLSTLYNTTANLLKKDTYRELLNKMIVHSGVGIEGIEEKTTGILERSLYSKESLKNAFDDDFNMLKIRTKHTKFDKDKKPVGIVFFEMDKHESSGTQKFFSLLGPILIALHEGRVFFIDELDSRLHSLLFKIIVEFFNSKKYNSGGAQLIFTSHNTFLLKENKLRRDQMILVNKDEFGVSALASLYALKPTVRNDASFEKDYLKGLYGAIPSITTHQLKLF